MDNQRSDEQSETVKSELELIQERIDDHEASAAMRAQDFKHWSRKRHLLYAQWHSAQARQLLIEITGEGESDDDGSSDPDTPAGS